VISSKRNAAVAAVTLASFALVIHMTSSHHETRATRTSPAAIAVTLASAPQVLARHPASVAKLQPFAATDAQRAALKSYASLRQRVFLNPADKRQKANLLRDRALLKSLAPLVIASTAASNENGEIQNAALDLLYDALGGSARDTAAGVLAQLVSDTQIENRELAPKDRDNLAGVKAEALYEWVVRDPQAVSRIAGLLPGPVSRELWQTVQNRPERAVASGPHDAKAQK
jgi:hypothetical protein